MKTDLILRILGILLALSILPLLSYLVYNRMDLDVVASISSEIATSFSLLISTGGSFLVYLAFTEQRKANKISQEQNNFSKIYSFAESLNNRISAYKILVGVYEVAGFQVIEQILREIKEKQFNIACNKALSIMCAKSETLSIAFYTSFLEIFNENKSSRLELKSKAELLKQELIKLRVADRQAYLLENFNMMLFNDTENVRSFKELVVVSLFFEMDSEFRMNVYQLAYSEIERKYGTFLDLYFNGTYRILDSAYQFKGDIEKRKSYVVNMFTNNERILQFHKLISSSFITKQHGIYLIELGIFNMVLKSDYFIIPIGVEEYRKDLNYIKPFVYERNTDNLTV